ncbi:MAG: hypothetical protein A2X86_10535 [Bdellovibrionales bacterium GWA2_49_15]|nr:MAG: hypothetical protein A2X86_10535 [Bdellovibrionales bacterium GWA2_49_15]HAZ14764.1 hypothetical protein [Bdellovibrionales bacterium]
MKKFIVNTDLYESSDANVYTSYHLAKLLGLKPQLFFVDTISPMIDKTFHPESIHTSYATDLVWQKKYEVTVLEKISQQLERLSLAKEDFDLEVFEGAISDGVKSLKRHEDIELLSVGASEHGEINRLFFNTFAEKIFFNLHKETLVVRKKDDQFKKVSVLLDPTQNYDRQLGQVVKLIKRLKAKLHIICLVDVQFLGLNLEAFPFTPSPLEIQNKTSQVLLQKAELFLKELESGLKKDGIEVEHTVHVTLNEENIYGLDKLLHEQAPNLVMISPRSQFLGHFSLGSTTHYLMKHNNCNFYLLP